MRISILSSVFYILYLSKNYMYRHWDRICNHYELSTNPHTVFCMFFSVWIKNQKRSFFLNITPLCQLPIPINEWACNYLVML